MLDGEGIGLDGDFTAAYLAVQRLAGLAERDPTALAPQTVAALETLLARDAHARQTQARILYRDAASILTRLLAHGPGHLARASRSALERALNTPGKPRLAAAEAAGSLPLGLAGPTLHFPDPGQPRPVPFVRLLGQAEVAPDVRPRTAGRSHIVPTRDPDTLLVVKRLRRGEDPAGLVREAVWMRHCAGLDFPVPCHVPRPLGSDEAPLVAVTDAPDLPGQVPDASGLALAYLARRTYFAYPNDPPAAGGPDAAAFAAAMTRAALLLGWLAGRGILHEAAIPLFHNRVQQDRREDGGVYDWRLPGRLDRWLASSLHPNFGLSGLRDFEHLASLGGRPARLYRRMGDHFVSLFLVAGSYYRMREPSLRGRRPDGSPVDARHLFDEDHLTDVVAAMVAAYRTGFVGRAPAEPPFCARALARRMIEEMGVDRHMTELVRVADQEAMTDAAFVDFCVARGMAPETARGLRRGQADVELVTGPHLGAFNDRTSLPELAECTAAAAAACLVGRYFADRGRN
jgi:hypothetical protein